MTVRVGINATSLNNRASGARQRFVGLYGALFRLRPDHEFLIYEPTDCRVGEWFADLPNVRAISTPLPSDSRWKRWALGLTYWRRQLARDRLDLFEALHLPLIRAPGCPTILTVHDARPVRVDVPLLRRTLYRRILCQALRGADEVVTVSDTMKSELAGIEPRAVLTTIYNGIDPGSFQDGGEDARLLRQLSVPDDFLLAVGHFEPRKNYASLIDSMVLLRSRHPDLHLLIVGHDGGSLADTRAQIEALDRSERVLLLTHVDDVSLGALYRAARLLVFPSLYEGFGIPILEAMAAGLPMVLSDLDVFRELTEDKAAYFPAQNPAAMAAAIAQLLDSPSRRQAMADYGRRRVENFSFGALACELDKLHERIAAAKPLAKPELPAKPMFDHD